MKEAKYTVYEVAGYLCKKSGWEFSNLQLQKLVYFAQLHHLGMTGDCLFDEEIQAWKHGPVVPDLYQKLKFFGDMRITEGFMLVAGLCSDAIGSGVEKKILDAVCRAGKKVSSHDLIIMSHIKGGSWDKRFEFNKRNIVITKQDMLDEYSLWKPIKTG